jgi:hypothetical protein
MRARLANIVRLLHRLNQNVQGTMAARYSNLMSKHGMKIWENSDVWYATIVLQCMSVAYMGPWCTRTALHLRSFKLQKFKLIRHNCVPHVTTGDRYLQISTK